MNINLEKDKNLEKGFSTIFITTFTTIFIAELGDKTQIAFNVICGIRDNNCLWSSLTLISSSLVGVLIGNGYQIKFHLINLLFLQVY